MVKEGGRPVHTLASLQEQEECNQHLRVYGKSWAGWHRDLCHWKCLPLVPLMPVFEVPVSVLRLLERISTHT